MDALNSYEHVDLDYRVPGKMKALVLRGKGFDNIGVEEVPVPQPGPDQLLARVDAAGVCTSILKIIDQAEDHKHINGWDPRKHPLILGDEGALTIVKTGKNLEGTYKIGEKVGIQPAVDVGPINHRERYRNNGEGMVKTAVGYTLGGQLAEYLLIQEEVIQGECLIKLPKQDIPYFAVSMCEPISCVVSAQTRHVHIYKDSPTAPRVPKLGIKEGGCCVIVGSGSMGKIHIELAMRYRPAHLIAVDPIQANLDWVRRVLGGKARGRGIELAAVDPDHAQEEIERRSGGKMADDIIIAVGIRQVQNEAMRWLGFGGVADLFGGLKKGDSLLEIDNIRVHYDEIKVAGSSGGDPHDYLETVDAIVKNDIDPGNYVAGVGSLENAVRVLKMIKNNEVQGKVILYPHIKEGDLTLVDYWNAEKERQYLARNLRNSFG